MTENVEHYLKAMKVPDNVLPWKIQDYNAVKKNGISYMFHVCIEGLHMVDLFGEGYGGYTVMSDNDEELMKHMPAVTKAKGHVLKTGLGFGCFVRGCLENPEVKSITVIEKNPDILDHFGNEFKDNSKVTLILGDALTCPIDYGFIWDMAWHDIYCDGNSGLQLLHGKLLIRFSKYTKTQSAWNFPEDLKSRFEEVLKQPIF